MKATKENKTPPAWMRAYLMNTQSVTDAVCSYYGELPVNVFLPGRCRRFVWIRQVCAWVLAEAGFGVCEIAQEMVFDHGTISHSLRQVENARDCYPQVKAELDELKAEVLKEGKQTA